MTAALYPEGRSKEEFVDEFLTCSICAEPYDSGSHQAKCLPCLHTYCRSCLQGVASKRATLNCPKCRKLITLPGGTVESLLNNFIVENLREYENIFDLQVLCGNCDGQNPAVRFCHDCGSFQCQACTDNHQTMRSMRHHKLVTLKELQAKKYNPITQRKTHCTRHPQQELNMYCKSKDCSVPVCATCGLVDHKNHDLVHLDAAIDEIVTAVNQSTAQVHTKCAELIKASAHIEAVQKSLADNFSCKQNNIHQCEQELTNLIRVQCTKARDNMKKLYHDERTKLSRSKESVDLLVAQMNSACEFANQSCDMSNTTQLLSSQKQIIDRLSELANEKQPNVALDRSDFVFTGKHYSALTGMKQLLKDLCDIRLKMVDALRCTIQLNLGSAKKGFRKKGRIQLVDSTGQKVSTGGDSHCIQITQGEESAVCVVQDNKDGTYSFAYNNSRPLHVQINGVAMQGSPFQSVPRVDVQKCSIRLGLPGRHAREKKAIVQTVDTDGHEMTIGNAKITAMRGPGKIDVQDNNNGRYTMYYGIVNAEPLHVEINGTAMQGSPFETAPQVDPKQCTIQYAGNFGGNWMTAIVQTVDCNGDKMITGNAKVEATQGGTSLNVQDNHDGTYTFNYYTYFNNHEHKAEGQVTINGIAVQRSQFR